jgi:hypothetical protein
VEGEGPLEMGGEEKEEGHQAGRQRKERKWTLITWMSHRENRRERERERERQVVF